MVFSEKFRGLAKIMVEKLLKGLCSMQEPVPEDVKEGQFAVYAVDKEGGLHRFVVSLGCLDHPEFVGLLELAADEFGLEQESPLLVPCQPRDLQRILRECEKSERLC